MDGNKDNIALRKHLLRARLIFLSLAVGAVIIVAFSFGLVYQHEIATIHFFTEKQAWQLADTVHRLDTWHLNTYFANKRKIDRDHDVPTTIPNADKNWAHDTTKTIIDQFSNSESISIRKISSLKESSEKRLKQYEREALALFNAGQSEWSSWDRTAEGEVFRLVVPYRPSSICFKCHTTVSSKNAVFGAISIEAPVPIDTELRKLGFRLTTILGMLISVVFIIFIYFLGFRLIKDRIIERDSLIQSSQLDSLTGLINREAAFKALEAELSRSRRMNTPLSISLVDIDHIQVINERYGRNMGDHVIKTVASLFKQQVRDYDTVGRISGQEFIIVFPQATLKEASEISERLRATLADLKVKFQKQSTAVTISVGVAQSRQEKETVDGLFSRASGAVYNAKANGHNRVEVDDVFRIRP